MRLTKIVVAVALLTPNVHALQVCQLGDNYKVLESEAFDKLRQKKYRAFSEEVTPETLFSSSPTHYSDIKPSISEAAEHFPRTSSLLEKGATGAMNLELAGEATSLLSTIGHSAMGAARGAIEVLGPVGDAIAVGLWAEEVAESFADETQTSYDRFATVMSLIDWFGVLKLPARDIDRHILINRWNNVTQGDHYSFQVHQDPITLKEEKEVDFWVKLISDQNLMLKSIARGYATDVALKYQASYQHAVHAQSELADALIKALENELNKTIFYQLGLEGSGRQLFATDFGRLCESEIDKVVEIYSPQEQNNRQQIFGPSPRQSNKALSKLQKCQQSHLNDAVALLDDLRNGEIENFNKASVSQLYFKVLNAKKRIVDIASTQLEKIRDALIEDMRAEGLATIDHLFDSGAVNNAYQFFKSKADRLAIDIMARSILGRPAKPIELRQRYFVLQESYRECVQLGIIRNGLGGDPNFRGCTRYERIPATIRHFDSSEFDQESQLVFPDRDVLKQYFNQSLDSLVQNGWRAQEEEAWLEKQLKDYSKKRRLIAEKEKLRKEVLHWLFDTSESFLSRCGAGCAGWPVAKLREGNLSPQSSLTEIKQWYESNKYSAGYKRVNKLGDLLDTALEKEQQANEQIELYSFVTHGSFDLDKHAPLIVSALENAQLDLAHLDVVMPMAKRVVKQRIEKAMSVAKSNGSDWLYSQIGDFHRYYSIVKIQEMSTGHFSSGDTGVDSLFSEPLPAHLLRYLTLVDIQKNIDVAGTHYSTVGNSAQTSYDTRLNQAIDSLFSPSGKLNSQLKQLSLVNEDFDWIAGRSCSINYEPLRSALKAVAKDSDLQLINPLSEWYKRLMRQQIFLFEAVAFSAAQQEQKEIRCALSLNSIN